MTNDILIISFVVFSIVSCFFGVICSIVDISNKKIYTPKDFYNDGYNWFGSWILFISKSFIAFPFYMIITLIFIIYKFIKWLFTISRKDEE